MQSRRRTFIWVLSLSLLACGGPDQAGPDSDAAAAEDEDGGFDPCTLLSAEQVATVFPEAKDSFVAHAGGSLVKGIDSYQCSYSDATFENAFLVIFHVAATDVLFEDIKRDVDDNDDVEAVPVGDGGWLTRTERGLKLDANTGRIAIELTLRAPGASERAAALTQIGSVLADRLVKEPIGQGASVN